MRVNRHALGVFLLAGSLLLTWDAGARIRGVGQIAIDRRTVEAVEGEVIVKFRSGATAADIDATVNALGSSVQAQTTRRLAARGFVRIRLQKPETIASVLDALRSSPAVELAEPNYVYRLHQKPGADPLLPLQWALPAIGVTEAWSSATGKQITVAVIDSGVRSNHPDLGGRVQRGFDFVDDDDDPDDPLGHGTMVAGIIAASRDNGIGISGIAPEAGIVPLRAVDTDGAATAADLAAAVLWAVEKRADVVNLSVGGPERSQVLEDAVRTALAQGVVICASVGNDGDETEVFPAGYPGVVGVGASTRDATVWPSSNTGAAVDFVAPGVDIVSTALTDYATSSGTSLATAVVSGAVALVLSADRQMTGIEAIGRLGSTARDIGASGFDATSGHGIPNVSAAIALDVPELVDVAVSSMTLETRRVRKDSAPRLELVLANRGRTKTMAAEVVVEVDGVEVARKAGVVVHRETKLTVDLVPPGNGEVYEITARVVAAGDVNAANDQSVLRLQVLEDEDASYVVLYKNRPFVHTWVAYQALQILPSGSLKTELTNYFWGGTAYSSLFSYSYAYQPPAVPTSWSSSRSSGASVAEGTWEEDEDDYGLALGTDSSLQHFWNPDGGYDNGLTAAACGLSGSWHSALYTARSWWDTAVQSYANGQIGAAYYALGRVAHLLGDMGVPDHVHNDPHPGDAVGALASICTDYDDFSNYEEYTGAAFRNYTGSGSPKTISGLPLSVPSGYAPSTYNASLVKLFYNQAEFTQHSDSSDVSGNSVGYGGGSISMGITTDGGTKNQAFSAIGYLKGAPNQDRMDLEYTPAIRWCDYGLFGCTWRSVVEGGSSGAYYDLSRAYGQVEPSSSLWTSMNNTLDYLEVSYRYNGTYKSDNIVNFRDSQVYTAVPDRHVTTQMSRLFPENIRYLAGLYQLFWDTTHPTITVTASDSTATESGPTTGKFTVTRNGGPGTGSSLTVYVTIGGTATSGSDYGALSSTVVIPAGSSSATVTVTPINDSAIESDETVTLTIASSSAYTVGSPSSATVTIQSDDVSTATVTVSATDSSATESGPTSGTFTITRSGGSTSSSLSVNVSIGGSATSGSDYSAISSPVTIPANSSSTTVTVNPINDSSVESDETVTLTISSGSGYTAGSPSSATVTITSDDVAASTVSVSVSDSTATEAGPTYGQWTISRSGGSTSSSLSVNVSFGGSADNGSDYNTLSSPVVIPAGSSSVGVTLVPINDTLVEGDESVTLTIQSGSGYSIGSPGSGTVTIQSDDVAATVVTISATDSTATESGPTTGQFTVTRSGGGTGSALSVNLNISGSASNGADYTTISSSLTIPAFASSATITVTPVNDTAAESDETVTVSIASGGGYSAGSPSQATVIITSDDSGGGGGGGQPHGFIDVTGAAAQVHELGVGPDGSLFVLFKQATPKALMIVKSTDGGLTWGSPVLVTDRDFANSDFDLAVDASGGLHVVWWEASNDQTMYTRSTDGGASFSTPIGVRSGNSYSGYSIRNAVEPVVGADGSGNVYVAFGAYTKDGADTFLGYNVWVAKSTNGGDSFEPEFPINSISSSQKKPRRLHAVGSTFYVLYMDESNHDLYFYSSTMGAFASTPRVNANAGAVMYGGDFVLGGAATIYSVYADDTGDSEGNVIFCRSTDGGSSWAGHTTVNDNANRWQYHPRIRRDSAGRLHVVWTDLRQLHYQTYYSYSTDEGSSFAANVNISSPLTDYRFTQPHIAVDDPRSSLYISATREITQVMVARRSTTPVADTGAPTGSAVVNSGASLTNRTTVSVALTASDNIGVTGYYLGNTPTPPTAGQSGWTSVAPLLSFSRTVNTWTIAAPDGVKTVYAWYKDAAGNVSAAASDSITLDQTPPANGTLTAVAGNGNVQLSWTGQTDALSGLASSTLVYAAGATPPADCTGTALATASPYTHTGLTNGQTYSYRLCSTDNAGNVSTGAIASATPSSAPPAVTRYDHFADGKADVFWRNSATGKNWMYRMNGAVAEASLYVNIESDRNWQIVGIADFDGDGKSDVLWRNKVTGKNWMYRMNGNVPAGQLVNTEANLAWTIVGVGDFDGDKKADILWRNTSTGQNWMYRMNGNVIVASVPVKTESNLAWKVAAVADFDADGKADILWRNSVTGQNWMYRMNGNVVLASLPVNTESDFDWVIAGVADFDGDKKADILWRNRTTGVNYLYKMNGNLVSMFRINREANLNWTVANVADYNGDGKADIFWRNTYTGENWMYLMNGAVITASLRVRTEPDTNWKVMR